MSLIPGWESRILNAPQGGKKKKKKKNNNHPNQALEIICTSLVVVTAFMFEFHLHENKTKQNKTLTIFMHAVLYLNITKTFCF